jgi:hypothetical protein
MPHSSQLNYKTGPLPSVFSLFSSPSKINGRSRKTNESSSPRATTATATGNSNTTTKSNEKRSSLVSSSLCSQDHLLDLSPCKALFNSNSNHLERHQQHLNFDEEANQHDDNHNHNHNNHNHNNNCQESKSLLIQHQSTKRRIDSLEYENSNILRQLNELKDSMKTIQINHSSPTSTMSKTLSIEGHCTPTPNSKNRNHGDCEIITRLCQDTFSLMMIEKIFSKTWVFAMVVFLIQFLLLCFLFYNYTVASRIPFYADNVFRVVQCLASILSATTTSNKIITAIKTIRFYNQNEPFHLFISRIDYSYSILDDDGVRKRMWYTNILFPNCSKLIIGLLVLLVQLGAILMNSNIVDLSRDIAAIYMIAELDSLFFKLTEYGHFGATFQSTATAAKQITVLSRGVKWLYFMTYFILSLVMFGFYGLVVYGQVNGIFFHRAYPNCGIDIRDISMLGNGRCDGGIGIQSNRFECGYDGGDCILFNMAYPDCNSTKPFEIGDGICQDEHKNIDCGYDGGDCKSFNLQGTIATETKCNDNDLECNGCMVEDVSRLGDGICNGGKYNTAECNFDFGDCDVCNNAVDDILKVGDGHCDGRGYMSKECNNDGGDCDGCDVPDPFKIGDGRCDHRYEEAVYNVKACSWDGGDCDVRTSDLVRKYPDCEHLLEFRSFLGNGICNSIFNNTKCGLDDDDCRCDDPIFDPDGDGWC